MDLKGKVALITGSASGIGKASAEMMAAKGAKIVVADINLEGAQATADEIIKNGGEAIAIKMDVTSKESVDACFEEAWEKFGGMDVAVANAGLQRVYPFEDFPFEEWQLISKVMGDGSFLTAQAAYRKMKESGKGGQIIFMGSVHSHTASKLKVAYVYAKHGVLGMARLIAKEGAPYGIHAYVVCPGFVRTPLVEKQIPEQSAELGISEEEVIKNVMLKDTVDGEFTTLEDVAKMVTFCAEDSGVCTGQSFLVTHGWIMK